MTSLFVDAAAQVVSAIFSAEFRIVLSASLDKRILGWSPFSDQVVFQLESHNSPILSMQHIPGRQQVITADTGGYNTHHNL